MNRGKAANHLWKAAVCFTILVLLESSRSLGAHEGKIYPLSEIKGIRETHAFHRPQGIFLDCVRKKIYIADTDNQEIAIFSFSGESLGIFQTSHSLSSPIALSVDSEGKVYISQREKNVLEVFDPHGSLLYTIPSRDFPRRHELSPGRFALSPTGDVYIINRKTAEIWVFDKGGSLSFCFGGRGKGEGRFQFITDIFLHGEKVYITDAQGIPVQVFTSEGKYLYCLGKHGQKREDFSFPRAVSVDSHERIWIVDAFRHNVHVYNREGIFLFQIGSYGKDQGNFCFPIDIDLDHENRLYILEKGSNRCQVFLTGEEATRENNSRKN
ncbi:MAG: 6-bladed beta-propeller [bacterium]